MLHDVSGPVARASVPDSRDDDAARGCKATSVEEGKRNANDRGRFERGDVKPS